MGESSVIEWTDSTWNPWRGCTKVSPGCADCYMFRDQTRYGRDPSVVVRAASGTFNAPLSPAWARKRAEAIQRHGAHYVFTCSWSDWFHETADSWREEAWDVIRQTPGSTYQILTKRPERIMDHLPEDWGEGWPNVWLGVTIENRRYVDRADWLRGVPAVVRFLSCEPLLGPLLMDTEREVELAEVGGRTYLACQVRGTVDHTWYESRRVWSDGYAGPELSLEGIHWVIAGGESGGRLGRRLVDERNRPLPERERWIRALRDATRCGTCGGDGAQWGDYGASANGWCDSCEGRGYGTAFLFKQWGGPRPTSGGRYLDGRLWNEMPDGRELGDPEKAQLEIFVGGSDG